MSTRKVPWRKNVYYHYYEFPQNHHVYPHGIRTTCYKLIYFYGGADSWKLFDLQKAPDEMSNLYGKPGTEKLTTDLKGVLKKLMGEYHDQEALVIVVMVKK